SVGVVPHMARLEAADIWLESARTGLTPGDLYEVGSTGNWDGVIPETSQDFDPAEGLKQAERLYQQVVDDTRRDARHRELALSGLFGLAAVAESRGEKDAAAEHYRAAKELAEAGKMPDLVAEAQARLDSLETLQLVSLPARADLYQPEPEVPETAPLAPPITPIPGEVTPEDEAAAESMIGGEEPAAVEPAPVDDPEQAEDET